MSRLAVIMAFSRDGLLEGFGSEDIHYLGCSKGEVPLGSHPCANLPTPDADKGWQVYNLGIAGTQPTKQ